MATAALAGGAEQPFPCHCPLMRACASYTYGELIVTNMTTKTMTTMMTKLTLIVTIPTISFTQSF
jgi:hypothetical protein